MFELPPLNPPDAALLTRFLLNHENPLALLTDSATDLLNLLAFLARPDINAWLDHYHALQARARQNIAASVLLDLLRDSTDPVQRRLAANALFQQSSRTPRTGLPRTPDGPASTQPRPHAARAATDPHVASTDAGRHRHAVERPLDPIRSPSPAPRPVPPVLPLSSGLPRTESADQDPGIAAETGTLPDSPPLIPSLTPALSPPAPSLRADPSTAMTLEQAMAALGIDPALLDIADDIEDAALDGDLADDLLPAALSGSLGRALQRAAEEGTLDEALEDAIDRGDHLSDHRLAAAFTASRAHESPIGPDPSDG